MAQLEFKDTETIEVMDTQAWIKNDDNSIEVEIIVTNERFLAVRESKEQGKKIVCSFELEEIERVEHEENNTLCCLKGKRFIKFDSDPIGIYLSKISPQSQKSEKMEW